MKQMFGTGLNLALELHLVQSLIYPGATFSTVPVKRYECPSIIFIDLVTTVKVQLVDSTCSSKVTSRGPNQNVISFSFYGDPKNKRGYLKVSALLA